MSSKNTSLRGKTVFITGSSRGIGLAIAIRCGRDGANVVILGKTATADPRLPGTIYTAAKEVEAAGGKALALQCDVRSEESVASAIQKTVEKFGGIDVVVNNASAIWPRPTPETPMKRFDLMNQVNARATFMVTKMCLPYLEESAKCGRNPHVLVLSPPLHMDAKWFQGHTGYTMSKMGMSMVVLGMSAEFADQGIAVNALWPRTAIATAAVKNVLAGDEGMRMCRTVDIMSDAAGVILTSPSDKCTGNFFVDDKVLRSVGVHNLDKYAVTPGMKESDLMPDFFIEPEDGNGVGLRSNL